MARNRNTQSTGVSVGEICGALESIAPTSLAESWDNVGLLAGDPLAPAKRMLLCIDMTGPVVDEAIRKGVDFIVAYHPPLFKPITRLNAASSGTDAHVFRCIANGIAIYSPHTAMDAAEGGTNDVLAELCGMSDIRPLSWMDEPGQTKKKIVVFVPDNEIDRVAEAMFAAGAGRIGEYSKCSYRLAGYGTFMGSEDSTPTVGMAGQYETVDEVRLETIVPESHVPDVVRALREAHSYEEPAYDIFSVDSFPRWGMGRIGDLPRQTTLSSLVKILQRNTQANTIQIVGKATSKITRGVCMVGAAGSMVFRAGLGKGDVVITGEIRHHDALSILRTGACAIAMNHWTSERPTLAVLQRRLKSQFAGVKIELSKSDCEPFRKL